MSAQIMIPVLLVGTVVISHGVSTYIEDTPKTRWVKHNDETMPNCSIPQREDMGASSDTHHEFTPVLNSLPTVYSFFHRKNYHIQEAIENFSVFKKISKCTCAVKDETAVCNELQMNQIPSCVKNSTMAVILISRNIFGINSKTFKHTSNLEYLNITRVDLRPTLPNDVFSGLYKLKHLSIQDHISMPELQEEIFEGLRQLESLYLYNNGLHFLPPNIFKPLRRLRLLNLANNNLRKLPSGIFSSNLELRELILNGNHLKNRYNPSLLSYNSELRVLFLKDTQSSEINVNLLANTTKLRWLDLSDNYIKSLPAETLRNCQKLTRLSISGNKFEKLDTYLLLQHYTELQRLDLRGNEWNCNCDIMDLAGWSFIHEKKVSGMPVCQQPPPLVGATLQEWFCSHGVSCNTTDLLKVVGEFIQLTEVIAGVKNYDEPVNISQIVVNCFFFGKSSKMGSSLDLILKRFIHLLGNVFQNKYGRNINISTPAPEIDIAFLARQEPTLKFSYIFETIPENKLKAVYDGLESEIVSVLNTDTDQEAGSVGTAGTDIILGLRQEFHRIYSTLQSCSPPSLVKTEMKEAKTEMKIAATEMKVALHSSSVIILPRVYIYIYMVGLIIWSMS